MYRASMALIACDPVSSLGNALSYSKLIPRNSPASDDETNLYLSFCFVPARYCDSCCGPAHRQIVSQEKGLQIDVVF